MPLRNRQYPMNCPVCRVAMVGEKSRQEREDYDILRCLNCGTVVEAVSSHDAEDEENS